MNFHQAFHILVLLTASGLPLCAQTRELRLNGLDIGIDEQTGSVVSLRHTQVGTVLQAEPRSAGLLDVAYPLDAFGPMRLNSRSSRAQITTDPQSATITWDPLGPSRTGIPLPRGKVIARVTLRAAPDARSVILECQIENRSSMPVPQVMFPDLHGLQPLDGLEGTELRFARGVVQPFAEPVKPPHAAPFYVDRGWKLYAPTGYYGLNALRWLDFGSLRGGLSMFQKRWADGHEPAVRTARTEADPHSLRLLWEHKAEIPPGASWSSGEFWLTPHPGGWAKGIEVFRRWVREVNPPRELPQHIRESIGYMSIWMIQELESDASRAAFRYADLPRVAEDARAHGIFEIVPWGWCRYFRLPIPLRLDLGSEQDLIAGIQAAKALGVNIAPFTSVHNMMPDSAARYGVKPGTGNWTYHPELIPNFRPFYSNALSGGWVDAGNKAWQQDVLAELNRWVERGMTSISWDQFSNRTDAGGNSGMVALIQKVRELARRKDPQSTFAGESIRPGSMEEDGAVLDYTWNWTNYTDAGPILNVLNAPRLNCNVEDSPLVVKQAFAEGLFLNVMPRKADQPNGTALISQNPALSAALKQVARLRRQFLAYFVEGTYLGSSVLTTPAPGFVRARQLGNRLLVVAVNDNPEATAVSFTSDLSLWLPSTSAYEIKTYNEEGKQVAVYKGAGPRAAFVTPDLPPAGLALFEIQPL